MTAATDRQKESATSDDTDDFDATAYGFIGAVGLLFVVVMILARVFA